MGLVRGWVTIFKQKHLIFFFILSQFFSGHCHHFLLVSKFQKKMYFKMLYYRRLTVVSPGPAEVGFLACNLLCYSSLIETSDRVKRDSPISKCFIFSLKLATEVDREKQRRWRGLCGVTCIVMLASMVILESIFKNPDQERERAHSFGVTLALLNQLDQKLLSALCFLLCEHNYLW